MNLLNKIIAFFTLKGEKQEIEVDRAEVKTSGVYLHPANDSEHILFIKSSSVNLMINPDGEVKEEEIEIINVPKPSSHEKSEDSDVGQVEENDSRTNIAPQISYFYRIPKKRFSVMLYQDEYDMLIKRISENGYRRNEYFLACMTSAKKQSMESAYKRYTNEHSARRKKEIEEAKREQEALSSQNASGN